MNYGSVCSGVEAATLAWERLGWTAKFYSEVEPFPSAVLCHRYGATRPLRPLDPAGAESEKDRKLRETWSRQIADLPPFGKVPNLGDFTLINKDDYNGDIDLLVGGTPCQSYSVAGLRKGLADPRGNLALEFVKLAYRTGVRWIVWENVPGVLSSGGGEDFASFLSLLCGWELEVPKHGWRKSGIVTNAPGCFGLAWRILDAQYTRVPEFPRAIPQRRRRIFVVGYLDSWLNPAKVLFDGEMCGGDTPPRRTKRQRIASDTESGADSAKWWNGEESAGTLTCTSNNQRMPDKDRLQCVVEKPDADCFDIRQVDNSDVELSPTLIATDYKGGKAVSFYTQRKAESVNLTEECSTTLVNGTCPGHQNAVCFQQNTRDEVRLMNGDGAIAGALNAELGCKQLNYLCYENHATDSRIKEVPVSPTITSRAGTGGNNLPLVMNGENSPAAPDHNRCANARREDGERSDRGVAEVIPKQMELLAFIKNDAGGDQEGYWEEVFPTIRSQVTPAVAQRECFNVTFCDANGTRKDRKNGGLYVTEAETSKTVTTGGTNAETVVIDPLETPIALDGDKMAKAERKGGSGLGVNADGVMYTQTVKDVHGVAYNECVPLDLRNATRDPEKHDEMNRQGVGVGNDGDPMTTISASIVPGVGWQATVRRLLPVECERLMGFPDNHTRIPWKGLPEEECPDAPRYKACGNSMCTNVMSWLGMRIDMVEKEITSNEVVLINPNGGNG